MMTQPPEKQLAGFIAKFTPEIARCERWMVAAVAGRGNRKAADPPVGP